MSFEVIYHAEDEYIEIKIQGKLDSSSVDAMSTELVSIFIEKNCSRAFVDLRETKLLFSTREIFSLPRLIEKKVKDAGADINQARRAILTSSDFDRIGFFAILSTKIGHNLHVFKNEEEAKCWLLRER